MPLYSFACAACATETRWYGPHADRPAALPCACGAQAVYSLGLSATPIQKEPEPPPDAIRMRGERPRWVMHGWKCDSCATEFEELLGREEEAGARAGRACPGCGEHARWAPRWSVDRFAEWIDTQGGYHDRGLGVRIRSPAERREECKKRNLVPVDGDYDVDKALKPGELEMEKQHRIYEDYVDRLNHHPGFAPLRRAYDQGRLGDVHIPGRRKHS